jgi:hypothetical protein
VVPFDPQPNQQVIAQYSNIIMDDREKFDGASMDDIANHFEDFIDGSNNLGWSRVHRQICLPIDEEVLWWLMDAPPQPPQPLGRISDVYIKVVDGDYDLDESTSDLPCMALSKIDVLLHLWRAVNGCDLETQLAFAVDIGRGFFYAFRTGLSF